MLDWILLGASLGLSLTGYGFLFTKQLASSMVCFVLVLLLCAGHFLGLYA